MKTLPGNRGRRTEARQALPGDRQAPSLGDGPGRSQGPAVDSGRDLSGPGRYSGASSRRLCAVLLEELARRSLGQILGYHRAGSARLPKRDVIGIGPRALAKVKRRADNWWEARKAAIQLAKRREADQARRVAKAEAKARAVPAPPPIPKPIRLPAGPPTLASIEAQIGVRFVPSMAAKANVRRP